MTVSLKIENDAELRAYIKDCINGQVLAIVREEFIVAVKDEIGRKINADSRDFSYLQQSAFNQAAKEIILQKNGIKDWSNDFIIPLANDMLSKRIDQAIKGIDWKKVVDDLAKAKVKALIQ